MTRALSRSLGINTWVWTSPLTDRVLPELLGRIARLGFDAVELPLENVGDLDPERTAAAVHESGLAAYVVGAMAPGRDLVATDADTVAATQELSARLCRPRRRARRAERVRALLRGDRAGLADDARRARGGVRRAADQPGSARRARRRGRRRDRHRAAEPLRDVARQHRRPGARRPRADARRGRRPGPGHLSPQHRGAVQRRRHPSRRPAPRARPGLRQRPRRPRRRPDRLAGSPRRARRRRLHRRAQHRELHPRQRLHRGRRLDLAAARGLARRPGTRRPGVPAPRLTSREDLHV